MSILPKVMEHTLKTAALGCCQTAGGNVLGAEPLSMRTQLLDGELANAIFASCGVALVVDSGNLVECLASDLV